MVLCKQFENLQEFFMKTVFAGVLACFSAAAVAADCVWTGDAGDGLWATPGNWEGEAAPTAADTAFVIASHAPCSADRTMKSSVSAW